MTSKTVDFVLKISGGRFQIGDRVRKKSGANWQGTVCGYYSSSLTPRGYAIESEREVGSVQIYPEQALEFVTNKEKKLLE